LIQIEQQVDVGADDSIRERQSRLPKSRTFQLLLVFAGYIVVALIAAGVFSQALILAGVESYLSLACGLGCGLLLSALLYIKHEIGLHADFAKASYSAGKIKTVLIDHVVSSCEVDDLEDFGPGFVLSTSDNENVYVAGQGLYVNKTDGCELITERMILHVDDMQSVVSVERYGGAIPSVGSCSVNTLPIDPTIGFSILNQ